MARRILRVLAWSLLAIVALIGGAVGVVTLTDVGRDKLAAIISDLASSETSSLKVGGINGIWGGHLTVDHVVMADAKGAWLVLRDVELDWSPLALLSSTFKADRVAVGRIELARLPQPSAEPDTGGDTSLPVSLDIARFELPDIAVGPELAGGIARLAANGSLTAAADLKSIGVKADVERTDGEAGSIKATVEFMPAEKKLAVDIVASEPRGGLLATTLGLPGEPAVDLVVSGSGPYSDWQGKGSFSIDGTVITTVTARHGVTNRGNRIEASGDGSFERFLPASLRPLVAGNAAFTFAGTLLAEGGIDVEQATLRSAAVTVDARGAIDPAAQSDFTLAAEATAAPVRLSFGEGPEPITLSLRSANVRATGSGDAPTADIQADLADLALPGHGFENVGLTAHSDGFDIASMSGPVDISLRAGAGGSVNETVASLLAGALALDASAVVAGNTLTLRSGSFSSGTAKADLSGTADITKGTVTADIKADISAAVVPETARTPLGERVALSARVSRDAAGAISVSGLDLASGGLAVKGDASLAGEAVDARLTGSLADVARLSAEARGAIDFALTASGPLAAPALTASVTADRFDAAGYSVTDLEFSAQGVADLANPTATVSVRGDIGGQRLEGGAELASDGGARVIRNLSLALGENRISGDLDLDEAFVPSGEIALTLPDLAPLAALALETVQGSAQGRIRFDRKSGTPSMNVDLAATTLKRGDMEAEGLSVVAAIDNYMAMPGISGSVRATRIAAGADIRALDVALSRDGRWTAFSGGATVNGIAAKASGRVGFEGETTRIEISAADAKPLGIEVKLARPTAGSLAGGITTLETIVLALGGGTVTAEGTIAETLALNVQVGKMPAGIANQIVPGLGAAGTISGTARITGAPADPTVGFTVDWAGAETTQTREAGFGAMRIASTGDFRANVLSFQANVGDGSGLGLKGGGTVSLAGAPRLALEFGGQVPFSFLTRRLAAQGLSLTGTSNVTLNLSGPASAPVVNGSIRASDARFVDARSGIAINALAADIAVNSGVATIRSLTGTLSSGGNLSAGGTIGIDVAQGFPADLTLRLTDGRYTDGRLVTASLSGDLKVTGGLMGAPLLAGTINLGKTVITVPERLPTSLARLGVEHRNASAAVRSQAEALQPAGSGGGGGTGLTLDLQLNAPQQIFIQGRGVDAELGGSLRLTGSLSAPSATGQFTLRRGRLSVLGKRLDFTRGTAGFSGSLVPTLDLAADSAADGATVTILVTGSADDPRFAFSSSPSLPEDEILARLVFGRSMSNLSPLQIAQLADAAAQIAGVGGPTSLLTTLRSKIGIDDLDVTTDATTGDAAVSAGKYLNDNTYVTIQKGEKAGSGKATINLDVGRGVKLRGEAAEDGKAKGGIFYEKEY